VIAAGDGKATIRGAGIAPAWDTHGPLGADPPRAVFFLAERDRALVVESVARMREADAA
jgi:hypothetical protein